MNSNRTHLFSHSLRTAFWSAAVVLGLWATDANAQPAATEEASDEATAEEAPEAPEAAEPAEAAPPPAPEVKKDEKPEIKTTYNKGISFETTDGKFSGALALRTQFRFESTRPTEDGAEFTSRFVINRARLQLGGHIYGKANRYKAEIAIDDRGSFGFVKDIYIERKLASAVVRVGHWKRPYDRQELVSDFASEFNERAVTAEFNRGGRDTGIAIHNDYEKSPEGLEWVIGVFNGFSGGADKPTQSGTTNCTTNAMTGAIECKSTVGSPTNVAADLGPTMAVRVGWNIGKIKGYSEADLEGGPLRLSIGASYKVDFANFDKGAESSAAKNFSHAAEVDLLLKNEGLDVLAGLYMQKLGSADVVLGGLFQAGYFVTPKQAQIAARFAMYQRPDDRNQLEGRAAFNYYLEGHAFKMASDFGFVQLTGKDAMDVKDKPDLQARIMGQLTF